MFYRLIIHYFLWWFLYKKISDAKVTRAMIRTTQLALSNYDVELAKEVKMSREQIDELIFKARNKHIQNVQYGKLPMEYDYMILNLFTDLARCAEHCKNVAKMIIKKEKIASENK